MDNEPTDSYPSSWYANHLSLKRRHITEKFPDARYDQTPVVLSELPSARAVTSALHFSKGTTGVEQGVTPGSQDEFGNTENDFDVQVRINRLIVVDTEEKSKDHNDSDRDPFWDWV